MTQSTHNSVAKETEIAPTLRDKLQPTLPTGGQNLGRLHQAEINSHYRFCVFAATIALALAFALALARCACAEYTKPLQVGHE